MKYRVFAALKEDINSGWIWIEHPLITERKVVKITNLDTGKKAYCEALSIDENFLNEYNQEERFQIKIGEETRKIVINSWYRKHLGHIKSQSEYSFEIKKKDTIFGKIMASLKHPQIIIRVAFWLGIIIVGLGILSIIHGIFI